MPPRLFANTPGRDVSQDAPPFDLAGAYYEQRHTISEDRDTLRALLGGRSHEGQPVWKGSTWDKGTVTSLARVNIGWMNSLQDQAVAIADFAARNDIEIGSADHEYAEYFGSRPQHAAEMLQLLGDEFFSVSAHYAFLSLAGKTGSFHYPGVQRRFRHQCAAESVFLPVADLRAPSQFVVHTWDVPERACVRLEDIAYVW